MGLSQFQVTSIKKEREKKEKKVQEGTVGSKSVRGMVRVELDLVGSSRAEKCRILPALALFFFGNETAVAVE